MAKMGKIGTVWPPVFEGRIPCIFYFLKVFLVFPGHVAKPKNILIMQKEFDKGTQTYIEKRSKIKLKTKNSYAFDYFKNKEVCRV